MSDLPHVPDGVRTYFEALDGLAEAAVHLDPLADEAWDEEVHTRAVWIGGVDRVGLTAEQRHALAEISVRQEEEERAKGHLAPEQYAAQARAMIERMPQGLAQHLDNARRMALRSLGELEGRFDGRELACLGPDWGKLSWALRALQATPETHPIEAHLTPPRTVQQIPALVTPTGAVVPPRGPDDPLAIEVWTWQWVTTSYGIVMAQGTGLAAYAWNGSDWDLLADGTMPSMPNVHELILHRVGLAKTPPRPTRPARQPPAPPPTPVDTSGLAPWRRNAFVAQSGPAHATPAGDRLGGRPWLPEGTDHPRCPSCGEPMTFVVQLDSATLPDGVVGAGVPGLLQLFTCMEAVDGEPCAVALETWGHPSAGNVVRVVDPTTPGALSPHETPRGRDIAAWVREDDYPCVDAARELGLQDDQVDRLGALALARAKAYAVADRGRYKLGGWPDWLQGDETLTCPDCGEPMVHLMDLPSFHRDPWVWGDYGHGYLQRCATHLDRLAFVWQC